MRLFLSDLTTGTIAIDLARRQIRDLMDDSSALLTIDGLVDVDYLGPELSETPPLTGPPANDEIGGGTTNIGSVSIAMLTIGSAAVVVLVGSLVYLRRNRNGENRNGHPPVEDDTMLGGTTCPPASPFTEMLPNAYRYTEEMTILSVNPPSIQGSGSGLSAVAELSSAEEQSTFEEASTAQGSIVISESGYTTEGVEDSVSFDMPQSLYLRAPDSPLLLGAKKRDGVDIAEDSMSEISGSEEESVNTNSLNVTQDDASATLPQQPDLLADTLATGILDRSEQTEDEALLFL